MLPRQWCGMALILGVIFFFPLAALAQEKAENGEVSLPFTLVTEGSLPATEVEGTFTLSKSTTERGTGSP